MKFIFPIDGDVLFTNADGKTIDDGILVKVSVSCESGRNIAINGVTASEKDGVYTAEVYLDAYRNAIEAFDTCDKKRC